MEGMVSAKRCHCKDLKARSCLTFTKSSRYPVKLVHLHPLSRVPPQKLARVPTAG